jgi:purine-cytosine permease-like protein
MGTFIGFAITNILFYFGGMLVNSSDTIAIVVSIQSMFFGVLLFMFIMHEITNAFADIYSSAISTQSVFHKINQRYLIIGFTVLSTILAVIIPISRYETFLLLIGAFFVPLFGVVLTDYYVVNRRRYTRDMLYGKSVLIGIPAITSWILGVLLYYVLSSLSPIYIFQWPQIGATIPSFIGSSLLYLGLMRHKRKKS